ncbi:MAG TPA: hypothetical protein VI451_01295, partial [Anaerolineales bacterium]|nr:hypothetical protein [Anaerolineales bacterium]
MQNSPPEIRLALPSKGRLAEDALNLLTHAGLRVHKPNPRQLIAHIPDLPGVSVLFQRAGDIVVSVRDGSVDFGITIRDNRLKTLDDGMIFESQAWLIANQRALKTRLEVLQTARTLIETIVAY